MDYESAVRLKNWTELYTARRDAELKLRKPDRVVIRKLNLRLDHLERLAKK